MKKLAIILFFIVAIVACAEKPSTQAQPTIFEILDNTYYGETHTYAEWHDHYWEVFDGYKDIFYEASTHTADDSLYHQLYDELSGDFNWALVDDWTGHEIIFDEELGIKLPVSPQNLHSCWYNDTICLDLDLYLEDTRIIFSKKNGNSEKWNPWFDGDTYRSIWLDYSHYQEVVNDLSNIYGEPLLVQPKDDIEQDYIWTRPNGGKIHIWVHNDNYYSATYIAIDK